MCFFCIDLGKGLFLVLGKGLFMCFFIYFWYSFMKRSFFMWVLGVFFV